MKLTVEDARNTWCCVQGLTDSGKCMATGCMAWRWLHEKEPLTDEQIRNAGKAVHLAYALQPEKIPARGYCGRAGTPV